MIGQRLGGLETFKLWIMTYKHFNSKSYNIFKSRKPFKCNEKTFEKRGDSKIFKALSDKYLKGDMALLFMSNILAGATHVSQVDDIHYREWRSKMSRLKYIFEEDIKLFRDFSFDWKLCFVSEDGQLPISLQLLYGGHVCLETMTLLHMITDGQLVDTFDKQINDTFIYPDLRLQIVKYAPYINVDLEFYKDHLGKIIRGENN